MFVYLSEKTAFKVVGQTLLLAEQAACNPGNDVERIAVAIAVKHSGNSRQGRIVLQHARKLLQPAGTAKLFGHLAQGRSIKTGLCRSSGNGVARLGMALSKRGHGFFSDLGLDAELFGQCADVGTAKLSQNSVQ